MAYAAVSSLVHMIKGLIHSSCISVASSTRESLESALDHASSLQSTLYRCSEAVTALEEQIIIEEARRLEDAIEFPLYTHLVSQSQSVDLVSQSQSVEPKKKIALRKWKRRWKKKIGPSRVSLNLSHIRQDVKCFAKMAKKMEKKIDKLWEQKAAMVIEGYIEELFVQKTAEEEDASSATDERQMVGLSDQFHMIRDELAAGKRGNKYDIFVWISGMAGIGKTRLAKRIYDDPLVKANFEGQAFVRVGQQFRLQEVLQDITFQLNLDYDKVILEGDKNLHKSLCRILTVGKFLIVLDDVWEEYKTLVDPLPLYLEEYSGSRILVTSRTDNGYYGLVFTLKMRFMNEEESWELLRREVFGEEKCPSELEKAGKKIAEKCEGLPLLIITVAPILLSKAQKNPESWKRVAEKPKSVLEDASYQISQVLLSSYHRISEEEKLCFLYIAAFPQSYIVRRSTITNLWCAEGFKKFFESFDMLVERNLVVERQKCWSTFGREHKACSLHTAYWYLSKREAKNNKFLYTINSCADDLNESVEVHRRLAIHENVLLAIKEVHNKIAAISTVRSLLCTGPYHQYQVPICWEWKLLRILNVLTIRFYRFPVEVVKLIRVKYLALTCNENLPRSISKLCSLEYLIVHQHVRIKRVVGAESYVPVEIWDLKELIHLEITGRNLPDPPSSGAVLPKLEKLLDVGVESCTENVFEGLPDLLKLRIRIELAPDAAEALSCFDHISRLRDLWSFKSVIVNPTLLCPPPPFSISECGLRRLSLSGFGYPWEELSKISALPNLYVLKLQCYAFRGEKWELKQEEFPKLYFLLIEDSDLVLWKSTRREKFPWLEKLTMKNCHKLREIPRNLPNLSDIELVDCNPLAETCVKERYGSRTRIIASYSWKDEKVK